MGTAYGNQAGSRERDHVRWVVNRVAARGVGRSLAKTRSSEGSQGKLGLSRVGEETELSFCSKLKGKFSLSFIIRKGYIMYQGFVLVKGTS